ncbi:MAG: DNA polymerase IV [Treponema sp.]|nr:DNA polymerase IV [Treponema sp.]
MQSVFLHVDLDAFFASVEQLDHPEWRGKPVIVGGKPGDRRSVVSTASYEAREFGVHSAMPLAQAVRLCPNGIYVHGRMERYHEKSQEVMAVFKNYSPDVQQMSVDEAFIDLTGTERLFGAPIETAKRIKSEVLEKTGLTVSIGIATTKYLAKIASGLQKPDGLYAIAPGEEESFMLNLPLEKVWGIGKKSLTRLNDAGIRTTKEIHRHSLSFLSGILGPAGGAFLYNTVRGLDNDTFVPAKSHSVSSESTYAYDLTDRYAIETALLELCYTVMFRLLREKIRSHSLGIKIRYEDFTTVSIQETSDRDISSVDDMFERAKNIFYKKYESGRGIRLLGVAAQNVESIDTPRQADLFDFGESKKRKVEEAILKHLEKDPRIRITKARMMKD